MTANRQTRITIDSERILIVARRQVTHDRCEPGGADAAFVQQEQAGHLLDSISAQYKAGAGKLAGQPAQNGLVGWLKSILRFLKVRR